MAGVLEAYKEAAIRLYRDGDFLHDNGRLPEACHLYGLAAECALKNFLFHRAKGLSDVPHKHLPELLDDVRRLLGGRRYKGLAGLLSKSDYMDGWEVENRYWADAAFSVAQCDQYRDHARRTLIAVGLGVI